VLQAIWRHDGDAVAFFQLQLAQQISREMTAEHFDFMIGQGPAKVGERRAIIEIADCGLEHRDDGPVLVHIYFTRHALRIILEPWTILTHLLTPSPGPLVWMVRHTQKRMAAVGFHHASIPPRMENTKPFT